MSMLKSSFWKMHSIIGYFVFWPYNCTWSAIFRKYANGCIWNWISPIRTGVWTLFAAGLRWDGDRRVQGRVLDLTGCRTLIDSRINGDVCDLLIINSTLWIQWWSIMLWIKKQTYYFFVLQIWEYWGISLYINLIH